MLVELKRILNTYDDETLKDMELWINSNDTIDSIIITKNDIDLITYDTEIKINDNITKERY